MWAAAVGVVLLIAIVVIVVFLLRQPDDPELDGEELPGLIAGNWPRVDEHLDDD